jgi:hypothetical protein
LTNEDFATILKFAHPSSIGYGIYALILLFPFTVILVLLKKHLAGAISSTILLISQLDALDHFINIIIDGFFEYFHLSDFGFLLISGLLIWLIFQSVTTKSLTWYCAFIAVILIAYLWTNQRNCRVEFIGDLGIIRNDLRLWFTNCGTYYAWWAACILLNTTIFRELRDTDKSDNQAFIQASNDGLK